MRITRTPFLLDVGTSPANKRLYNDGPATLYYKTDSSVSSTSNDGSIVSGSSLALTSLRWIATASGQSTDVRVVDLGTAAQSSVTANGTLPAWASATAVTANEMRTAPDGTLMVSLSARTTGGSFDSTEASNWATIGVDTATLDAAIALKADTSYVDDQIETVFALLDDTAPSTPGSLTGTFASDTAMNLSWNASTDNIGVIGYRVYRDAVLVGSPSGTAYSDTGLAFSTSYTWTVTAVDAAGNESAASTGFTDTTGSGSFTLPATNLVFDWNAESLATADDATVGSWVDSVSSVSLTASGTPKMRFAEINSKKVVEYGGAAGTAKHDSAATLGPYAAATKIVVAKLTASPGASTWALIDQVGTNVAHRQRILTAAASGATADAGTTVALGNTPDLLVHAWAGIFNGNTGSAGPSGVRRDASRVNGSVGTGDTISVRLGQSASGTQTSIMVTRVLVYSAALDNTQLDAVFNYLGQEYGVTV